MTGKQDDETQKASELPPPGNDFRLFVQSLAHQAAVALGLVENPMTKKTEQDLIGAGYFVELLGMLEEKTKGNLSADEKKFLADVLGQLRLAFVELKKEKP